MDRIAICEVYNVLAHDYGLYGIKSRLNRMGFRSSPLRDTIDRLDEDQQWLYAALEPYALHTDATATRLAR